MLYLKTIHLRLSRHVWGNSAVSIRKFHQIINSRTANIIDILYYVYTYMLIFSMLYEKYFIDFNVLAMVWAREYGRGSP